MAHHVCPNATFAPTLYPAANPFFTDPMTPVPKPFMDDALKSALAESVGPNTWDGAGRALEIGGPTPYLGLLVYDNIVRGGIDNVVRPLVDAYEIGAYKHRGGVVAEICKEGDGRQCTAHAQPYTVNGVRQGTQYFAHGADLPFEDEAYAFVMASHNLEHYPNPLKALLEWDRILKPGGYMFLNLPDPRYTFDWKRKVRA